MPAVLVPAIRDKLRPNMLPKNLHDGPVARRQRIRSPLCYLMPDMMPIHNSRTGPVSPIRGPNTTKHRMEFSISFAA